MSAIMRTAIFLLVGVFVMTLAGCGGGSSPADIPADIPPLTPKVLHWTPPQNFADQTPLDPARDLKDYEIYVNESGTFSVTDAPMAVVSAVNSTNGSLTTSFDLANLGSFLSKNKTYYLSMQSVSITGIKSDFSPVASFSL